MIVWRCYNYDQALEAMDHLLLGSVYNREIWATIIRKQTLYLPLPGKQKNKHETKTLQTHTKRQTNSDQL
jgi:hypothetical protein